MSDLISRADAIEAVADAITEEHSVMDCGLDMAIKIIKALPSADAVDVNEVTIHYKPYPSADAEQGWRIGKPTEQGKYMVTLNSFGHKHIDLFYYGKPMMPNRKVRGKCWYRSDDEWGDVVYDDKDIIAWIPLPTPYKGGDDE